MKNLGAKEAKWVLNEFLKKVTVKSLESEQDAAFLIDAVLGFIKDKGTNYRTTEDENHKLVGIIYRFMRTLRDLKRERGFSDEGMKKLVAEYNYSVHSSTNKVPNDINKSDKIEYFADINTELLMKKVIFDDGDHVRLVLAKNKVGKNRSNLSTKAFIIDGTFGIFYLI